MDFITLSTNKEDNRNFGQKLEFKDLCRVRSWSSLLLLIKNYPLSTKK